MIKAPHLLFAILTALAATPLRAAATCGEECWAAAVVELGQEFHSIFVNAPTEAAAVAGAQGSCGDLGCVRVATVKNGCVALAVDLIPYAPLTYGSGVGATKDEASAKALAACQRQVGQACVPVDALCTFNVQTAPSTVHPLPRPLLDDGSPEATAIFKLLRLVTAAYLQNTVGVSADGAKRLDAYGPVGTVDELNELLTGRDVRILLAYVRGEGLVHPASGTSGTSSNP